MTEALIPTWSLGDRLRKAREERSITQAMMAAQLRVSRSAVAGWENGKHRPGWLTLEKWAELTQVPVTWIETGEVPLSTKWPTATRRVVVALPQVAAEIPWAA